MSGAAAVAVERGSRSAPFPLAALPGLSVHALTEAQCVEHALRELEAGRGGRIATINLDILRRCAQDEAARALVSDADLRVADGMPLVWAARLQGMRMPERVTGSNLITSLSVAAGQAGRSVFLLGGEPGAAEAAAEALRRRAPGLRIAGVHSPPFGFESDETEMARICKALREVRPDIVYVALGFPKQERLIGRIRGEAPNAWWMGVGISFSFLSGHVKRAPVWMQRLGLEWVHRLWQEPGRLARRYLVDDAPFAAGLLIRSVVRRGKSPRSV